MDKRPLTRLILLLTFTILFEYGSESDFWRVCAPLSLHERGLTHSFSHSRLELMKPVFAQEGWKEGIEYFKNLPGCPDCNVATLKGVEAIFRLILNVATQLAVLAVFIMLIIGGFKYLTSGGDPKATESAQKTITYAILGLVALIGIWLILKFIYVFTGVNVTQFVIPAP